MSTDMSGPTSATGTRTGVPQPRAAADGAPSPTVAPSATPPPVPGADYRGTPFRWVYDTAAQLIDRWRGGDNLAVPGGLAVLIGVRNIPRQENLHDPPTVV